MKCVIEGTDLLDISTPEDELIKIEIQEILISSLRRIRRIDCEIIVRRFLIDHPMTLRQIAITKHYSVERIRTFQMRGLNKLAKEFHRQGIYMITGMIYSRRHGGLVRDLSDDFIAKDRWYKKNIKQAIRKLETT